MSKPHPPDPPSDELDHDSTLRRSKLRKLVPLLSPRGPEGGPAFDLDFGPTLRGLRTGFQVFGKRYALVRQIGRGGMGVVWLARDTKLDLDVALKFLPEELRHDRMAVDDLRRETKRCLSLTHPLIVRTFDLLEGDELAAISMEYVEGSTLSELRAEKPLRVFEAAEIEPWLRQVCEALTYAHEEARLVHRDIKPTNIMINAASGRIKLADFGIASGLSDTLSRFTRAGANPSSGTLVYMSPQQLMGHPPAVTDDVYSLGATLYELFTSKPPFFRGSVERQIETMTPPSMMERRQELQVVGAKGIPEAWERLVAACLDKNKDKRPARVAAMLDLLKPRPVVPVRSTAVVQKTLPPPTAVAPAVTTSPGSPLPSRPAPRQSRLKKPLAVAASGLVLVGITWLVLLQPTERDALASSAISSPSASASGPTVDDAAQKAAAQRATEVAALVLAGREAFDGSDYPAARSKLEAALVLEPGQAEAVALLDDVKTAETKFMQEQQAAAQLEAKKKEAASLVAEARRLFTSGSPKTAKEKLVAALYLLPADSAALSLQREVDDALLADERARNTAAAAPSPAASSSPPPPLEPTLPAGGYFPLDQVFDGTSYDSYNTYARGQILRQAQQKLKADGLYSSAADGDMGPGTQQAIIGYQRQRGLPLTGKLDYSTQTQMGISGMRETSPPAPTVRPKPKPTTPRPSAPRDNFFKDT